MEEQKNNKQELLRKRYDRQYGHIEHKKEEFTSQDIEDTPEMNMRHFEHIEHV